MTYQAVIREVAINGVQYGMRIKFDIDKNVYKSSQRDTPWQWQNYTTRNNRKMRRMVRISRNTELFSTVLEAFYKKYLEEAA